MNRARAGGLIVGIRLGEVPFHYTLHSREKLVSLGCSSHDVMAILQNHSMPSPPEWTEAFRNFHVEIRGKNLEGRPLALILGLREAGPCVLITVMTIEKTLREAARRRST